MILTRKVKLLPTKEQLQLLIECCGVARFSYNLAKELSDKYFTNFGKTLNERDIRKYITQIKKTDEYKWLNNYSCDIPKQAVKDFDKARKNSFRKYKNGFHTNFKKKDELNQSFFNDTVKTKIGKKNIYLSKIGAIRTTRQIPRNKKIYNPRVTFDGLNWYISIGFMIECENQTLQNKVIGIDVGIKNLAVTSDGLEIPNINKTAKVKKLEKIRRLLQKRLSRQHRKNKVQSNNYYKTKEKCLRVIKRLTNIRDNHIHQATNSIVKELPSKIVIEDLSISNMMKNRKIAKAIQNQKLYFFVNCLTYKCEKYGITLVKASRTFPSSQICNVCGNRYDNKNQAKPWSLGIREWTCSYCKIHHDRDINAAINLSKWVG